MTGEPSFSNTSCSPPWYDSDEEDNTETENSTQGGDEAALVVDDLLDRLTAGSNYIKKAPPCAPVARFHYDELRLGDLLHQGSFGETRPVENIVLDDLYAVADEQEEDRRHRMAYVLRERNAYAFSVKQVSTSLREQGDAMEICRATAHLLVDIRYLARMSHPNILRVHALATSGMSDEARYDNFSIVTDRVTETLRDRLASWKHDQKQQQLMRVPSFLSVSSEPESVLRLKMGMAWQLADALDYLHQRYILYGNLTPDTIGFKQDLRNPHTSSDSNVQLISFEQAREVTTRDQLKSDVHSWSYIFYEMLTLQSPDHDEQEELRSPGEAPVRRRLPRTRSSKMSQSKLIPVNLQLLLKQAWHRDPAQRLSIAEVVEQLDNTLVVMEDEESHIGLDLEDTEVRCDDENDVGIGLHDDSEEESSHGGSLSDCKRRSSFLPEYYQDTLIEPHFLDDMSASVQNNTRRTKEPSMKPALTGKDNDEQLIIHGARSA